MLLRTLKPVQIAYHVPDPRAAALRCAERFGWGPFFLLEHIALERCLYRGRLEAFDHSSAYGQAGDVMVELITGHGSGPSALRDMYSPEQSGVHHVACFVPSLTEALASYGAQGFEIAMQAWTVGGVEFAMVDARRELGHMLELYERGAELDRFYAYVKHKAQGWDGTEPVRRLSP